jgi:hypothetical protein
MRTVLVALVLLAALASPASAAVIHEPADGVAVQQSGSLFFDWAWDSDEYWTDRIIFTQVADPNDPIWLGGDKPGKVRYGGQYGFAESQATVTFSPQSFGPGTWYWRLCNKTIYGEDDKCYVDAEVRSLVVTPGPACADGTDNDLDGKIDWPWDSTCTAATGTTEGAVPQCADGLDNDGDGLLDQADDQCSAATQVGRPRPAPRPDEDGRQAVHPQRAAPGVRQRLPPRLGQVHRAVQPPLAYAGPLCGRVVVRRGPGLVRLGDHLVRARR